MDNFFRFKKFDVRHQQSMRVGTDSVLLGSWINPSGAARILDIGTGSSLLALMLAQRTQADTFIDGIDINPEACEESSFNVKYSPWADRIKIFHVALQNFNPVSKYDLIVTNPPFFVESLKPSDPSRANARHTDTLSHEELLDHSLRILLPHGRLSLVLPAQEGASIKSAALKKGFHCSRICEVRSKTDKPVERLLLEFTLSPFPIAEIRSLILLEETQKSMAFRTLTADFYLD